VKRVQLVVNGNLMRGLDPNENLLKAGAMFVREDHTAPGYRLWSINDDYPAMQRVAKGGTAVALEVWDVPMDGVGVILMQEPLGLAIGKVHLSSGEISLGVLGEAVLCEGQKEITAFGGWRNYLASKGYIAKGEGYK
jgi:hypothetical protein